MGPMGCGFWVPAADQVEGRFFTGMGRLCAGVTESVYELSEAGLVGSGVLLQAPGGMGNELPILRAHREAFCFFSFSRMALLASRISLIRTAVQARVTPVSMRPRLKVGQWISAIPATNRPMDRSVSVIVFAWFMFVSLFSPALKLRG